MAGVVHVVDAKPIARGPLRLTVECFAARLLKNGMAGLPRPYNPAQVAVPADWLRPSDRHILRRLARLQAGVWDLEEDDEPVELLRRLIATGRARWADVKGQPLSEGPALPGQIEWQVEHDGTQRPALRIADGMIGVHLAGAWYAAPDSGTVGPLDIALPRSVADQLLAAPPVPAAAAAKVAASLGAGVAGRRLPAPADLGEPTALRGPAVPELTLTADRTPVPQWLASGNRKEMESLSRLIPLARLSFRYGPLVLASPRDAASDLHAHKGRLYRVERDMAGEDAAVGKLLAIGLGRVGDILRTDVGWRADDFMLDEGRNANALPDGDISDWPTIVVEKIQDLRDAGWTVSFADDFPFHVVEADGDIDAELHEGSGIDWLELHLGVMIDGIRVDLVPSLVALLANGLGQDLPIGTQDDEEPFWVPLPGGRLLSLPLGRVRPMLQALMELFAGGGIDPDARRIRFSRLDAADLAFLEERSGIVWRGGESVRALGRQLRSAGGAIPAVAVPAAFRGSLRPYQAEGVAWLQFLRAADLGGVLADDMGLGKTVQTLAHLAIEQAEGRLDRPALIVCPTSLVPNWTLEAERFAPTLRLLLLHGPARKQRFHEIGDHDLVLTTYPLLARDHEVLTAQEWHAVILDEAQTIKNPNAETTRRALMLKARQRLCLSGTPLQNHLGELWSMFDFLSPGFLGNARQFRTRYRTPIEKHGDGARQASLARRVRPFLLRRTKDEVVLELPPKTEILESVEMGAVQRAIYDSVRLAMHEKVRNAISERGLARSGIVILEALLKMRQACCDPRLLKLKSGQRENAGSAKLERLMEMLETMLSEGRRVLLFSQFTSMLALVEARLAGADIPYVMLTGDTTDRSIPVRRFQAGEVPVFLISLKAGGVGLNLTAADTVIHYDPWWNPAAEDQATDRAHRIGQDKPVFVHRLIAIGTIEEKMGALKDRKRALAASVLDAEHGGALKLSEADIEDLFAAA